MTGARRSLCGAADIKGWSTRLVPEQIRAQQALVDVMLAACREARLPEQIVQSSGDGVLIMAPSDIDESDVIPNLIQGLEIALHQENRLLADAAKIRLRFSLTSGMVTPGPAGVNGAAVVECFRLLDSPPVKDALMDYPHAQLAVIVSDYLFQDVIRNGFRNLRAEDFWPARAELPDKGFSAGAWLYVNDRKDGPPVTSTQSTQSTQSTLSAPPAPSRRTPDLPGEIGAARALMDGGRPTAALRVLDAMTPADSGVRLAFLDVRADGLLELREYERARRDLEEMLRLQPDPTASPGPSALLRLGRCHARLGDVPAAWHTWTYLLEHQPMMIEPYLELGRLERRADRPAGARSYLIEGLRLVRSDPSKADRYLDEFLKELTDLPATDQRTT